MGCCFGRGAPGFSFGSTTFIYSYFIYNYVNDLPTVMKHSQVNMYADGTELHLSGHDLFLCSMIFSVILMLSKFGFMSVNFNVSRSVVMLIGTKQRQINVMCLFILGTGAYSNTSR